MSDTDILSQLLATQLLEEDLQSIRKIEQLQLDDVLKHSSASVPNTAKSLLLVESSSLSDVDFAYEIFVADARVTSDRAYAEYVSVSEEASLVANRQHAQQVAATEKKMAVDNEFARQLQKKIDSGEAGEDENADADTYVPFQFLLSPSPPC